MTEKLSCPACGESRKLDVRRLADDGGGTKVEVTCSVIVHDEPLVSIVEVPRPSTRRSSSTSGRSETRLTREDIGAWLIKSNPKMWDIHAAIADDAPLDGYRLFETYRITLMRPGDLVLVWATKDRSPDRPTGFVGEAVVDGEPSTGVGGGEYWIDIDERDARRPYVPLRDTSWWDEPLGAEECRDDEILCQIEVLRVPVVSSPSYVTPAQLERIQELMGWSE